MRLREELAQLQGLPPCPQPPATAPVNSTGQYISPFNTTSGYTGYRPFYCTPGDTPAPPAYNTPGYTSYPSYYNSPFYNAPVYNAPWEGGGFYFGPTGSASFLQDSDLIKRIEPIVNSSDWNFAYQLGAGVRYQVMPNWSLDLDYRYRGIIDTTLRNKFEKITVPYRSHNFVASVTWQLPPLWGVIAPATPYTPPPPPPPPPGLPVM